MKILDHFTAQAAKAGIDISGDAHKAALEALGALTAEIPDDLVKAIDSKFITIEAAGNNHPTIKGIYQKQALDAIDKSIKEGLAEIGVTQDVIDQLFKDESSTFKRGPVAFKLIKELEAKKASASKPDQAAIQKQIEDLNASIRTEKEFSQKTLAEKNQFEKDMKLRYRKNVLFSKLKTKYDDLDPEDKFETLDTILNRSLQENNAVLDFDENGNLAIYKKAGETRTNYFGENNTVLSPDQYIDGVMGKKKLLVVSAPPPKGGEKNNPGPGSGQGQGGNAGGTSEKGASPLFKQLQEESLKDLKAPAAI